MDKIEIPLSKKHIAALLLRASGFVVMGILLTTNPHWFAFHRVRNLELIQIIGVLSIIIFGLMSIYGLYKILGKKPGLTIDENGITDLTASSGVRFIHWEDIVAIKREQLDSTKFLLIFIDNPEYYLVQGKWGKRSIMRWNYKTYGTPLCISADLLKCNPIQLEKVLAEKIKDNKSHSRRQSGQIKTIKWSNTQIAGNAFG